MKQALVRRRVTLFMCAVLTTLPFATARRAEAQALPTPQVEFGGTEDYEVAGKQWTKYKLALRNRAAYANELFTPAPDLPPCGDNKNSSRTWVDIYNRQGRKRLYGFCALKAPTELGYLWFAVEKGSTPPESVYLTITDRLTNTKATSNVVVISSPGTSTAGSTAASPESSPAGAPDLIVKEIVFDQSPSKIRVRVLNQGNAASSSCHLALQSMVGDSPSLGTKQRVWTIPIPAMEAGKGFSNVIDVAPLTQTNGPWKATIDRSNAVVESNESNNTLTYPSSPSTNPGPVNNGRLPDLVIERFKIMDPATGDVSVLVKNIGFGNAAASTLRLIVWEAGQFEQKEAKTVFVKVRALGSREWAVIRVEAGVPIINTKYSLFIDISEEVVESNENNNRGEGDAGNFKP